MYQFFESCRGSGKKTESAGTAIVRFFQGMKDRYTYLTKLTYTPGATSHVATVMRKIEETTVVSAVSAGGTSCVITADPGSIAINDNCAIQLSDGTWHRVVVSGVSTLTISFASHAIPTGKSVLAGARFVFYGVVGDSAHDDYKFDLTTGSTTTLPVVGDGVLARSVGPDEPLILSIDNETNAGTLKHAQVHYSRN